jgi:transcriptional regulator with XRE-family HTH domain
MISFGSNLKRIRTEKLLSQGDLAELIGIHSTHISRYERDLTQPTLDVIKKISTALNVDTDTLIYGDEQEQTNNKIKDSELLNMFSRVQSFEKQDVECVKNLLNAYILKTDLQQKLAV